ncbi:MAG TPA: hypothetical protein VFF69_02085 [Phycisphaerales bacterium]|nr:hypothetical protein [Phycisphaerales bacterium]
MPMLPRARKWISTFAAFLLLGAFILSLRCHVTIRQPNTWRIEISAGAARINWDTGPPTAAPGSTQYDAGTHSTPVEWWPRAHRRVGWPGIILPLWLPALATGVPAAVMWRRALRPSAGLCPRCRYARRGLPENAPCPECGHILHDAPTAPDHAPMP